MTLPCYAGDPAKPYRRELVLFSIGADNAEMLVFELKKVKTAFFGRPLVYYG